MEKPNSKLQETSLGQLLFNILENYFEMHKGTLPPPGLYKRILFEVEKPLLFLTLKAVSGNQQKAAHILGINRNTLRKKIANMMKNRDSSKSLKKFASSLLNQE